MYARAVLRKEYNTGMGNIPEIVVEGKAGARGILRRWGIFAILFAVAITSFALGKLSATERVTGPIALQIATSSLAR